jgi:hypothetical protein
VGRNSEAILQVVAGSSTRDAVPTTDEDGCYTVFVTGAGLEDVTLIDN